MIYGNTLGVIFTALVLALMVACSESPEPAITAKMLAPELVADKLQRQQQLLNSNYT